MEGIPVKISEKYKPPRKITLPASVLNKFNSEIKFEKYDFDLERLVVEQMGKLRDQQEKLREQQAKLSKAKAAEEKAATTQLENTIPQSNILTPVPLKPYPPLATSSHQVSGGINISDFENDTSSPFDSVELKTLNDMEELAHVLGGTTIVQERKWSPQENGVNSWAWGRAGYTSPPTYLPQPTPPPVAAPPRPPPINRDLQPKPVEPKPIKEMSTILQSLQKQLEERKAKSVLANMSNKRVAESPTSAAGAVSSPERPVVKKPETLPNPLSSLSPQCQAVARMIAEMGFPLSRAARATEMFGPNEGKVIEFMLEVQSLEEAGYPGERAERALVLCDYSRENTVKLLDSAGQLMRLGFPEEDVLAALARHGYDRDRALDSLIS